MWRDRTNLYISYRQSYSHHPTPKRRQNGAPSSRHNPSIERQGLLSAASRSDDLASNGEAIIEMDRLPPRWLDISERITNNLRSITTSSAQLDTLHRKHLLPSFEADSVRDSEERQIERLTREITGLFMKCQNEILRIKRMVKSEQEMPSSERAIAQNMMTDLAGRVAESSAQFRKKQSRYLEQLGKLGNYAPLDPPSKKANGAGYQPDYDLLDSEADASYGEKMMRQTQVQATRHSNDTAIAQREKEINDIAQGIIDLATLFRDLQSMVIDQGTMLDRIDHNIEIMKTEVQKADEELKVGAGYQKKSRNRKIILLLIILIIGAIILLTIKPRHEEKPVETPKDDKEFLVGDGVKGQPNSGPARLQRRCGELKFEELSTSSPSPWKRKRWKFEGVGRI